MDVHSTPTRTPFDLALSDIEDSLVPLPAPTEYQPIPPSLTTVDELRIPMPGDPEPSQIPPAPEPETIEAPPIPPAPIPPPVEAHPADPPAITAPAEPQVIPPVAGGPETPNSPFKAMREAKQRESEALAELQVARERERQLAGREEQYRLELERLRQERAPAADPNADAEYVDPFEQRLANLERANIRLLQENQQSQQALQQQMIDARVVADDASYVPEGLTHADYEHSRDWYIEQQVKEAEINGEIDLTAAKVRQQADAPGNEQWNKEIRTKAIELGTTEAEICRAVARQALYQNRLTLLQQTAQRRGTSVPALVFEAAKTRGWTGTPHAGNGNGAVAAPPVPTVPMAESATNLLHNEQRGAVESSLASMPTTSGAPASLLTGPGFMSMDRNKQGQLIDYMDQAAARGMVPEDWMEQLNQGVSIPVPSKLTTRR